MDNKLCANPSTNRTLEIEGRLPFPMVPEPMILPFWLPPNFTSPPGLSYRLWNIYLLPVICREQPESRYHDWCFNFIVKDISPGSDSELESSSIVAMKARLACSS